MFEIEGCEIEFRKDSLKAVAIKAMQRKTGARGLRTILENTLLDIMYDLPAMENVSKVVVDAAVIEGDAQPYILYEGGEMQRAASDQAS
jgi:ATP-dependent Clp protease ATP-binding subunit ClpX